MLIHPAVVDPLAREAPLHGLTSAATVINLGDADRRAEAGITWRRPHCDAEPSWWSPECDAAQPNKAPLPRPGEPPQQAPVVLFLGVTCDTVGLGVNEDDQALTRGLLEAGTSKAIESAVWGVDTPGAMQLHQNQSLVYSFASPGNAAPSGDRILTDAGDPMPRKNALAALGAALAGCGAGSRGIIHAPAMLGELWAQELLTEDGPRLRTKGRGDWVVVGSGYPGTGPVGAAAADPPAGSTWAFASGPVTVRLGPVEDVGPDRASVINRSTNDITWFAERTATWQMDACCVFAALVDLT